ncbi:ankyrin repeat domain-containing protein [Streptomyces sp. HU2014]|uniref:ankyrin repeat domain-containing protein n=1 Tax=Streptomyces sp. HU2014 TaxID=2939414 RepID=UPI00200FADDF|nr:ankyrin repeat domain-containing protein [Streptomyces sp. HU2014]UQI45823.1 ankyrin repeat domain-containing protein [Streptomyces sp. HU2014]
MTAQVGSGDDADAQERRECHEEVPQRRDRSQGADATGSSGISHPVMPSGEPQAGHADLADHLLDDDEPKDGTIALWEVLMDDQPEFVEELVAAGADPWRPVLGGWSPGRLSLAGPTPDLFVVPEGERGLNAAERAAAVEAKRLRAALGDLQGEGLGLVCVAGIDAQEAIRRLDATPVEGGRLHALQEWPWSGEDIDEEMRIVGVTTVPGGCIVTQPWGYVPETPGVQKLLSVGTVCYGMYANAKSGNQGSIARDGVIEGGDLHPGGGPNPYDTLTPEEVLLAYLHQHHAVAHACAWAGLRPTDARAVTGPPDTWVELPLRDYWKS